MYPDQAWYCASTHKGFGTGRSTLSNFGKEHSSLIGLIALTGLKSLLALLLLQAPGVMGECSSWSKDWVVLEASWVMLEYSSPMNLLPAWG